MLKDVLNNDDASLNQVYTIYKNEQADLSESRVSFKDVAEQILADARKCIEDENMPSDEKSVFSTLR